MHFKKIRFRTFTFYLTTALFVIQLFTPSILFYTDSCDSLSAFNGSTRPISEPGDADAPMSEKEFSEDNIDVITGERQTTHSLKNRLLPVATTQVFLISGIFIDQQLPPPKVPVLLTPAAYQHHKG